MYVRATSTRLSRGMSTPARRAMSGFSLERHSEVWSGSGARASDSGCPPLPWVLEPPDSYSVIDPVIEEPPAGGVSRSRDRFRDARCASSPTSGFLALPLLVPRVLADDHHVAVTTDHLALVADGLDAGVDLHDASFAGLVPPQGPFLSSS